LPFALIHSVNVETDRLLKDARPNDLAVVIGVKVVVRQVTWGTVTLTGDWLCLVAEHLGHDAPKSPIPRN
jgi:hypothetical protein